MSDEMEEVFRGHLDECLQHLGASIQAAHPKGSRALGRARAPVAEFCGVGISTVIRWLDGSGTPVGEQRLKVSCYLDLVGYRVIELERLPTVRRNYLELVGFGILSSEQAAEVVRFAKTSNLSQVLQGHAGTSKAKESRMWEAWKSRKGELEQKKAEVRARLALQPNPITATVVRRGREHRPVVEASKVSVQRPAVVSLMEGLLALLEEDSFEERLRAGLASHPEAAAMLLQLLQRLNSLSFKLVADQIKGGD